MQKCVKTLMLRKKLVSFWVLNFSIPMQYSKSQYWVLYLQTFCSQIGNTSNQEGFIEGNFKKYLMFESLLLKVVPGTKYTTLIDLWGLAWQVIVHILQAWYSVLCKQGLIERCTWVLELHEVTREWTLPSSRAKRRR